MNFFNKVTFKIGQRNLKNSISEDGTITNKKLSKAFSNSGYGFNAGWFVIGLLGGLIGVLLAYVINGEEDLKKNRQKWAWIGFAAWVVIYVILLASIKVPV